MFKQEQTNNLGIWQYATYLPFLAKEKRVTLGEGKTSLTEIEGIYFKREDLNPTGSVKDRGLAYQVSYIRNEGFKQAAISSSGNAAYSALVYTRQAGIKLKIFVSGKINPLKLKLLKNNAADLVITDTPIKDLTQFCQKTGIYNLRSSLDSKAIIGYTTIPFELQEKMARIDSIFIPVSSATTLVGIYEGFKQLGHLPQIHAVQTANVCPVSSHFDHKYTVSDTSIADAIVARFTPREKAAVNIIRETGGSGWVISDQEILLAAKWLIDRGIDTSYEGAMTLAGINKARKYHRSLGGIVCLLTGVRRV